MRLGTFLLLFAIFGKDAVAQAASQASSAPALQRVVVSGVWLRREPSIDAERVRILLKGSLVCTGRRVGSFIEVRIKTGKRVDRGYMSRGFVVAVPAEEGARLAVNCAALWN